jgi:hypothetical protein
MTKETIKSLCLSVGLLLMLLSHNTFLVNVAGITVWIILALASLAIPLIMMIVRMTDITDADTLKLFKGLYATFNKRWWESALSWILVILISLGLYENGWVYAGYSWILFSIISTIVFTPGISAGINKKLDAYTEHGYIVEDKS